MKKRALEASQEEKPQDIGSSSFVEQYKKEALWRDLQAALREQQTYKDQIKHATDQRTKAELSLAQLTSSLETLAVDIEMVLQRSVTVPSEQSLLGKFLLSDDGSAVDSTIQSIRQRLSATVQDSVFDNEDLLAKIHQLTESFNALKANSDLKQVHLEELESQVEVARHEASLLAKKLDRERSATVQRLKPAIQEVVQPVSSQMEVEQPASQITPEILSMIKEHEQLKEESDLAQQLANEREQQLHQALAQVSQLRQHVDKLKLDFQALPDSLLKETGLVKELQLKLKNTRQEALQSKASKEEVLKSLDTERQKNLEASQEIQAELTKRMAVFEGDIKKLQSDMNRVRNQRDQLQQQMEVEKVKYQKTDSIIESLKSHNEASRLRVTQSLADVKKLQLQLAQASGDELFYKNAVLAYETQGSDDAEVGRMVNSLQKRLASTEEQLNAAKERQTILENHVDYSEALKDALLQLENCKSQLKIALQPKSSSAIDAKSLSVEIVQLKQIRDGAFAEVESISNMYTDMEVKYRKQVEIAQQKDEEIQRLTVERTKYDQKLLILQKERDGHSNKSIALSRQTTKLQELIKAYEQEDVAQKKVLSALEKELAQSKQLIEVHDLKAQQAQQLTDELQAKVDKSVNKYDHVASLLRAKDVEIEASTNKALAAIEENRKLQNKLKHGARRQSSSLLANLVDGQDVQALREEVETLRDYKRVAQCTVCQFRLKDHVLLKCMHVFCKECVDARIDTRQRKCPTCGVPFSVQEVKQIFI